MSTQFELQAELRTDLGRGASRRLRREQQKLPAILYGAGKEPQAIALVQNKVLHALENEAFYSSILSLDIEGKKEKVVLKDLHRHPCKPFVFHMDLQRVDLSEKLHMNVPLHFENEDTAPGVKQGGGVISHLLTQIEIHCLPADLPEFIAIDLGTLELDQILHLSDISMPKGVELLALAGDTPHDLPVVSLHLPRVAAAAEEEAPTEEAAGEEGAAEEGQQEGQQKGDQEKS